GVPKPVIDSAKRKLAELELLDVVNASNESGAENRSDSKRSHTIQTASELKSETQLSMSFETPEHWLAQKIKQIDIDDLTPRQALALLYQWRKELK
ncbi:MAG: DNA mismatch repair protein MutS, partial [Glaciecola sp.]